MVRRHYESTRCATHPLQEVAALGGHSSEALLGNGEASDSDGLGGNLSIGRAAILVLNLEGTAGALEGLR